MNFLLSNDPTNEELLQNTITISKPALLEYTLLQMKVDKMAYTKLKKKPTTKLKMS